VSWQQYAQTENVRAIADAAQELYSRVLKFSQHFAEIRSGLEKANAAFRAAQSSYDSRVRPSGERLLELCGQAEEKELPNIRPLEETIRVTQA